jgi:very-short-patch-repair endonuclease
VRSWAEMPTGRVIRLVGASAEAVAMSLSPLPNDAPAVVTFLARSASSPGEVVATVLSELETMAIDLFPAWLPGANDIKGSGGSGTAAVRAVALQMASTSQHFGPFLADLAVRALTARPAGSARFAPEVRAAGLARVTAASFGRPRAALLVHLTDELPSAAEPALVAACEWLADRAGLGVWLFGRPLAAIDRVEPVTPCLPGEVADLVEHETAETPAETAPRAIGYPAVAGRPHPRSRAEQALEARLAQCDWATGRAWNQAHQTHRLANPIRVDLLWVTERCVVEIDGPEHRGALQYAADRRRDVQLQLHGYAVLRFTNAQILYDIKTVLSHIEQFVRGRRLGVAEGQRHVG